MPESGLSRWGQNVRVWTTRVLARFGLGESSFLLILSVAIGVLAAGAAVAFHELIEKVRQWLYVRGSPRSESR
jgi:uncharacterized RDD family membrane protein YckC